jgi:response regulator RpfG family c-di-GMP phosphodiesterase
MPKILIVDDDDALRSLMKIRLAGTYEVIDTGNPVQALGLALEHKPDAILLDLMMPNTSGFELCESLHTLSYTSQIPIFIVSGESAVKYREHVALLGAKGFFEKPVNFPDLKKRLSDEIQARHPERRAHVRVRMRLVLKLKGQDEGGRSFEQLTTTENVSAAGFLCNFSVLLGKDAALDVFIASTGQDCYVGKVRPARIEARDTQWQRYGFQFIERTKEWIFQDQLV